MRQLIRVREVRCVIAVFFFGAALGLAQEYRGRVQGVVGDSSGAVIPGVAIVLKKRCHQRGSQQGLQRRRPLHLRLRRSGNIHPDRRHARIQEAHPAQYPGAAARRRDGGRQDGDWAQSTRSITISDSPVALQFNTATPRLDDRNQDGARAALRHAESRSNWRCSIRPSSIAGARSRRSPTTTEPPTRWTWAAAPSTATTFCSTARR